MKRRVILATAVIFLLMTAVAVASSQTVVTETLRDRNGNTWTVTGYWGELDGRRAFFPVPPNGQVWIDASRYETQIKKIPKTEYIHVQDIIKTPTATLRQEQVGSYRLVLSVNNPNSFPVVANIKLTNRTPDPEVANLREQEQRDVILSPGVTNLIFDSAKRREGFANYTVIIRVTENRHPNIHPDYVKVQRLGKYYSSIWLYIDYLP